MGVLVRGGRRPERVGGVVSHHLLACVECNARGWVSATPRLSRPAGAVGWYPSWTNGTQLEEIRGNRSPPGSSQRRQTGGDCCLGCCAPDKVTGSCCAFKSGRHIPYCRAGREVGSHRRLTARHDHG